MPRFEDGDAAAVHAATDAQRKRLFALRADGTIGDAAFQRVEEELDWAELDWAQLLPQSGQPADNSGGKPARRQQRGRELLHAPVAIRCFLGHRPAHHGIHPGGYLRPHRSD